MSLESFVTRKNNYVFGRPFSSDLGKTGFGCFLYEHFLKYRDRIFQVHAITGETETYSDVLKRSVRVALELKKRGITENDVIATCSGNSMDCFIPIFATQLLNASVAILDPSQPVRDVIRLLNVVEPKIIFVENDSFDLIEEAKQKFSFHTEIVVMGDHIHPINFNEFLAPHPEEECFQPKPIQDYKNKSAFVLFSSGTTGMPKGISLSGYRILSMSEVLLNIGYYADISIHVSTFYWISALMITVLTIFKGGRKVILPQYELDLFLKAICDHKISFTIIGPHIAQELNEESCSKYNLTSLNLIIYGGSAMYSDQVKKFRSVLPNTIILPAYGLTEASGLTASFPVQYFDQSVRFPASCGLPLPGTIFKIVNPETEEVLGINQRGEIRTLTECRFIEYYKVDSSDAIDHEGFIKTGDIGYFDEHNFLYICDRIKDMFKYKLWHITPASVESVIYQHPAIKEAVVIGIPHPVDGDHPMAIIVLKDDHADTKEKELIDFINERVLDREKLRGGLKIVKNLPRTPSGKISRVLIRKQVIDGTY